MTSPAVTGTGTGRHFIVYGALRSGTTLLRLMLDGHPRINCPGEMDFVIDHLRANGGYDHDALVADRIYRAHEALFPDAPLSNPTPAGFADRVAGPADGIAAMIMHRHLPRALEVFDGIKVLHLVRDPRDVARSSIGMGWAGNVWHGADHWIGTMTDWQAALPMLPEDRRLVVAYEDLIAKPEETLGAICAFAGLEFHPDMLSYDAQSSYGRPDPSLTVQWKRKQTPAEVGLVEAKIGPLLGIAGYEPSGYPAPPPGAGQRAALWIDNKRAQWAFRIRRFGLRDTLLVKISEWLRLPGLARAARRRMDEISIRHLK